MTTAETWHKQLGHASSEKLTKINFLSNFSFDKSCDSCFKAKHTRIPFSNNEIKTSDSFDLLHCDIWGKYRTPLFGGLVIF